MGLHPLELRCRGEGADVGRVVVCGAEHERPHPRDEGIGECVGDSALHVDTFDRHAQLAHRGEAGRCGVGGGLRRVDVVEHDEGVLAAEFEGGADQSSGGALADPRARGGRTRETHVVDGVDDGIADDRSLTGDDGPEGGRNAGVDERAP